MTGLVTLPCAVASLLLLGQAGCGARAVEPAPPVARAEAPVPDTARPLMVVDTEESLWPDPVERTWVRLANLRYRIEGYRLQAGRFPASLEELLPGSADRDALARDAWGGTFALRPLPNDYELRSSGPDRVLGTPDDVVATSASERPEFRRPPGQRTYTILQSLQMFAAVFHKRTGRLPDRPEDLSAAGFSLYLGTLDEWQRPVVFTRDGSEFVLRSAGPDGTLNTTDDVVLSGLHPSLRAP